MGSIQKGYVIAKNEFGTLERVDHSNTCIGSTTLPDGKVITKRFRGTITDQDKTIASWEKWQGRENEVEDTRAKGKKPDIPEKTEFVQPVKKANQNKTAICPFTKEACGPMCPIYSTANLACSILLGGIGLYNLSVNMPKYEPDDSLELIAMAINDLRKPDISGKEPYVDLGHPTRDVTEEFFDGKSFMAFVNLTSKKAHADFKAFCKKKDVETVPLKESELSAEILRRYKELERKPIQGGVMFLPRG